MNEIFNYNKIYTAYLDCRRNKRKTINALKFEQNLEMNLFDLQKDFELRRYVPSRSICFAVSEPSLREIFAADFRDRVVHHLLVNELIKIADKTFIYDSFACRKNKGTHAAVEKLKIFIKKVSDNNRKEAFYAQLDIASFFMSIDHEILYNILERQVLETREKSGKWKEEILYLSKVIIFHKPTENYITKGNHDLLKLIPTKKSLINAPDNKGLPIGNYSSQFFTSLYLNKLDQFVKRELKCKYYVRYMDDFIVLDVDKNNLEFFKNKIDEFLQKELLLKLNPNKTKIQPLKKGIDFLGYFIKPNHSLIRRRVVKNLINKLENDSFENSKKTQAVTNSYFGHFCKADTINLRFNIFDKYFVKLGREDFELAGSVKSLSLKKIYRNDL